MEKVLNLVIENKPKNKNVHLKYKHKTIANLSKRCSFFPLARPPFSSSNFEKVIINFAAEHMQTNDLYLSNGERFNNITLRPKSHPLLFDLVTKNLKEYED